MFYYLLPDKTYRETDMYEWSEQFEEMWRKDERHVSSDIINDKYISTVWLGINHNHFGGVPLLFETMIFDSSDSNGNDIYMKRHTTWDEAVKGHQKAIEWVKKHYG